MSSATPILTPRPPSSSSSPSSHGTQNTSSTFEYSHEPFTTYQLRIASLAIQIGFGTPTSVTRLQGGSYNRIVAVTLPSLNESDASRECIFRVPRSTPTSSGGGVGGDEDEKVADAAAMRDRVAVLHLLHRRSPSHLTSLVPRVLAYDTTAQNDIASVYMVQERLPGVCLDGLYDTFSLKDKLKIVQQVVDVLAAMEGVRFGQTGRLKCASGKGGRMLEVWSEAVGKEGVEGKADVHVVGFGAGQVGGKGRVEGGSGADLMEFYKVQFALWKERERLAHGDKNGFYERAFDDLLLIAKQIGHSGRLSHESTNGAVLWHWDFEPRNILVREGTLGKGWEISGILDWDDAMVVVPVLARRPLGWLWGGSQSVSEARYNGHGDGDVFPYAEPGDEDGKAIKARFDKLMEKKVSARWREEAYGAGRWASELGDMAIHGFLDGEQFRKFDRLKAGWKAWFEERIREREGVSKFKGSLYETRVFFWHIGASCKRVLRKILLNVGVAPM